jgi:hypothetical protein
VLDHRSALAYAAKYASKGEDETTSYKELLRRAANAVDDDVAVFRIVQRMLMRTLGERDITAQECMHLLLQQELVDSSRPFCRISASLGVAESLERMLYEDDEQPADEEEDEEAQALGRRGFWRSYMDRPEGLEHLPAIEFCRDWYVRGDNYCQRNAGAIVQVYPM